MPEIERETALGARGLIRQAIRSDDFETYPADEETLRELNEAIEEGDPE